jgi:hypothetical protein
LLLEAVQVVTTLAVVVVLVVCFLATQELH